MATLQTIRTRAGLLVAIVIGISLAAFVLGDMFQSGSSLFQGNRMKIGEIDGEAIQYPEFQREVDKLGDIYRMNTQQSQLDEQTWVQVREQTWQNIVREQVMTSVYENLGISVSSEELFDMLQGTNLHPIIQQLFRNPNTGQVDRGAVVQFLRNLETGVAPEQRQYWLYIEDQIVDERIQTKYNNLVSKGLYVTGHEAERSMEARNKQVSFNYIMLSNNTVADSQVVVTDKELRDYYNNNKEDYQQEKVRTIEYVSFPVSPSKQDYQQAESWINDIVSDFAATTDNVAFVNSNSDESFDGRWYAREELPEDIALWIFDEGADVNDVFGPYSENDSYKLAKLHASAMMPDSVKARHILLPVNTQEDQARVQSLSDSLKTAIESGSSFSDLAKQYSSDQGSAVQGGDLGWFGRGQMVEPFEEASFNNKINQITIVQTQFGIHLVQTTARGKESRQVQVAYIVHNVTPSTQTYQNTFTRASEFAGKNYSKESFDTAIEEQKLNKQTVSVKETDRQVAGLENSRPLIRAAYDTKPGNLIQDPQGSTIFDLGNTFIIATLVSATEEGVADFEDVKERVELAVLNDKKKEFLVEKAKAAVSGKSALDEIASELGVTVRNAANINFNSVQIPGAGMEPKVIGSATVLSSNVISSPIAGNNGVFVVEVTDITEGGINVENEKSRLAQNMNFRASSQAYVVHKEKAEIEDQRAKFY